MKKENIKKFIIQECSNILNESDNEKTILETVLYLKEMGLNGKDIVSLLKESPIIQKPKTTDEIVKTVENVPKNISDTYNSISNNVQKGYNGSPSTGKDILSKTSQGVGSVGKGLKDIGSAGIDTGNFIYKSFTDFLKDMQNNPDKAKVLGIGAIGALSIPLLYKVYQKFFGKKRYYNESSLNEGLVGALAKTMNNNDSAIRSLLKMKYPNASELRLSALESKIQKKINPIKPYVKTAMSGGLSVYGANKLGNYIADETHKQDLDKYGKIKDLPYDKFGNPKEPIDYENSSIKSINKSLLNKIYS